MSDYFTEIDLNIPAAAGGPISAPLDRRAMHYFGFKADGQQLLLLDGIPTGTRVLFSFDYGNPPGLGPVATDIQAHGALDFFGPAGAVSRYEGLHERAHVLVWLDGPPPPIGQQVRVRVTAWAKD
jgi:hypothetical protein